MDELLLSMPAGIVKRVCQVKKGIVPLKKDARNPHGGYSYATIDQMYDMVRELMANSGLLILLDEKSSEIIMRDSQRGPTPWLFAAYDIYMFAEEGERFGPVRRSIMVQATGPQSFQAAPSYVEKYFMRSVFKIPTGEPDGDDHEQEALPEKPKNPAVEKPKSPQLNEEQSASALQSLLYQVTGAKTRDDLKAILTATTGIRPSLWDDDKARFNEAFRAAEDRIYAEREGKAE